MGLTPRQRELLAYLSERETCPSYGEMRAALKLASKSSVARLVDGLWERGYVSRIPDRARSIELTPKAHLALGGPPEPERHPYDVVLLPMHGIINGEERPNPRFR